MITKQQLLDAGYIVYSDDGIDGIGFAKTPYNVSVYLNSDNTIEVWELKWDGHIGRTFDIFKGNVESIEELENIIETYKKNN